MRSIGVFVNQREDYSSINELLHAVEFASKLGVKGVQLYAVPELLEMMHNSNKRRELMELCDGLGIRITSICGDMGIKFHEIEKLNELTNLMEDVYDIAEKLKTNIVTTHVGVIPESKKHPRYRIMEDTFGKIAMIAEKHNAYLANETGPEKASVLKAFLDGIKSKACAVNFDPANIIMSTHENPIEEAKVLKDYIVHTHAKDGLFIKQSNLEVMYGLVYDENYNESDYCREVLLGQGEINWNEYLCALDDISYDGFLTIEREVGDTHKQDVVNEVEFLKRLLGARV